MSSKKIFWIGVTAFVVSLSIIFFFFTAPDPFAHRENRKLSAITEITLLDHCLEEYVADFGLQDGTNRELAQALMGDNPTRKVYMYTWSLPLNGAGEVIDPWGSPYFFKQEGGRLVACSTNVPEKDFVRHHW